MLFIDNLKDKEILVQIDELVSAHHKFNITNIQTKVAYQNNELVNDS